MQIVAGREFYSNEARDDDADEGQWDNWFRDTARDLGYELHKKNGEVFMIVYLIKEILMMLIG
ncbi:predicted protein [Sclerotinia sclerotiorum 1980 UF-70]|uniref:Uncharacterized protein n=1 Tax=Sclerotinia sclerotiorum (strain ATCC 18683 / 1980 / Ss-1) TaxID=665079 RepID=A7F9N0_SCLS1|nr:predicted protein [Sclerotinia sclerotiorum 1980 UF-70]EDO00441.1 predicted protein [Sclerotinia sclerotiorum 1980 UF-70]